MFLVTGLLCEPRCAGLRLVKLPHRPQLAGLPIK